MGSPLATPVDLGATVSSMRTVAVVGCSPRGFQTSHRIAQYLQNAGIRIVPVNPNQTEILGETCYPNLLDIPESVVLDVVCIFRRAEHTEGVVQDAADRMERTGQNPVVWTQLGVSSDAAKALATATGLPYVANRCLMVDHSAMAR